MLGITKIKIKYFILEKGVANDATQENEKILTL